MLTQLQTEPFKYVITDLKKILTTQDIEKESDHLKRTVKTLAQIANLNQFLTILLDFTWFGRLGRIFEELMTLSINILPKQKNQIVQEYQQSSPLKSLDQNRQIFENRFRKTQLTPSTKKSKVESNSNIKFLVEDLSDSLQKFDEIKQNSKRIKLLIQELNEILGINQSEERDSREQIDIETIWNQFSGIDFEILKQSENFPFSQDQEKFLIELLEQIQAINKFMQIIKASSHRIFFLIEHKSLEEIEIDSRGSLIQSLIRKQSNTQSEQRSLLTEMLRQSSQNSNIQIQENDYRSQIILKSGAKGISQCQDIAHLNEKFKIGIKSAKKYEKSHKKIKSQINYCFQTEKQEIIPRRNREVKIKKSQMGCSQCQIF